jgi:D-sedoheptulose 7-phosphate isomerase
MTPLSTHIESAFNDANSVLKEFCSQKNNFIYLAEIAEKIAAAFSAGNKVMICGNGGSTCDAMHFAEEFTGRFRKDRKPLPVIALTDSSHITCVSNDYGFEHIFARAVEAHGKPGDWLITLSTSGNSANIVNAAKKAQELGVLTFNLLGQGGGKLKGIGDLEIIFPGKTSDRIQELHMASLHILIEAIERVLFPELY